MKLNQAKKSKTVLVISIIGISLLIFGYLNYLSKKEKTNETTNISISKEDRFKKDEYCRSEYINEIKNELAVRWDTKEYDKTKKGYFTEIKEIFFSPSLNECVYTYDLNFYYDGSMTKEYIIARASTGDIIIDETVKSTYEKDKNYNFQENIISFNEKLIEVKR